MITDRPTAIQQIAKLAGKAIKEALPDAGIIEKEGRANIVTAADLASEKTIIDFIHQTFPHDLILSEETISTISDPLQTANLWVVDPIDGTNNFRYQRNYSVVSIGFIQKGVMQLAAVYDPFRDELFYAQKDQGASLNGNLINITDTSDLAKATIATDNSYNPQGTLSNLQLLLKLNPTPWVLIKGSAVLSMCDVAAGRIDLYFHSYLKPWDNAAAFLIAQEAGAHLSSLTGKRISFLSPDAVVGHPKLVDQFIHQIS